MRFFGVALLAASVSMGLLVTGSYAEPLRPGYPAGTAAARGGSHNTAIMIGTGAAIMAGVAILASGDSAALSSQPILSQAVTVPPAVIVVSSTDTSSTSSTP